MTEALDDELFAANAKGAYFTVRHLAPLMGESGAVVLTTSVANVKGLPLVSAYAATNAALRSIDALARPRAARGIRLNAVSPGPIDTAILSRMMPPEAAANAMAGLREGNPMGRLGRAEEVARAVLFLACEATFTTGVELPVDGGASQL